MRWNQNAGACSVRSRLQMLPLAAGAAVALGSMASSALGQFVWVGNTGTFSASANWQNGLQPPLSSPTTALAFFSGNAAAITATNDLGTPFVANSLTFNTNNAFTLAGSAAPNLFQLVGPSPTI